MMDDYGGEFFLNGKVQLFHGDSREVLKRLPDNSIDSVVTDPPYALVSIVKRFGGENAAPAKGNEAYQRASAGFMGRAWDTGETAFAVEFWAEVMRVLKPGGHVVAASGTRTYHRLAVAIEDAGFEIRDQIQYIYGVGFPKSHNVVKKLRDSGLSCACHKTIVSNHHVSEKNLRDLQSGMDAHQSVSGRSEQDVQSGVPRQADFREEGGKEEKSFRSCRNGEGDMQCMREGVLEEQKAHYEGEATHVQPGMQRHNPGSGVGEARSQGASSSEKETRHADGKKSSMEGRRDDEAPARELCRGEICEGPGMGVADGAKGRIHNGASLGDGKNLRVPSDADGGCPSSRSQPVEQSSEQSGIMADKRGPQAWGGWPVCNGCGKPVVPEGYGTALKPAVEPWVLARKPLIGTVAANVLEYGTGAINIDGCRVAIDDGERDRIDNRSGVGFGTGITVGAQQGRSEGVFKSHDAGRFPANVIHDGSDEVVARFPSSNSVARVGKRTGRKDANGWGMAEQDDVLMGHSDSGSAARFFYSAKADKLDRAGSKHPTVKPVDLMQYLCRLITPPGGIVLDPFAGSGSTGEAAWREGFRCVLIEREADYAEDIRDRLRVADQGIATRKRAIAKKKGGDEPIGGLFG